MGMPAWGRSGKRGYARITIARVQNYGEVFMAHSFTHLVCHIVFATKHRTPWLNAPRRPQVWTVIGGLVKKERGASLGINGVEDHVHMLVRLRPDQAVAPISSVPSKRTRRAGSIVHILIVPTSPGKPATPLSPSANRKCKRCNSILPTRKSTIAKCRSIKNGKPICAPMVLNHMKRNFGNERLGTPAGVIRS